MAEYKCICCGHIKESKKECTCPECGYKMFKTPYDRSDMLRKEISHFLSKLRVTEIVEWLFDFHRYEQNSSQQISKIKDGKRFPEFSDIQKYACSAQKTELFLERLSSTLDHISQYLHSDFQQVYQADYSRVKELTNVYDEDLKEALNILSLSVTLNELSIPEFSLDYYETPDTELIPVAEKTLSLLSELLKKVKKFVKLNNVYGDSYKNKSKKQTYNSFHDYTS